MCPVPAEGDTAVANAVEAEGDKAEDAAVIADPAEALTAQPARGSITITGKKRSSNQKLISKFHNKFFGLF